VAGKGIISGFARLSSPLPVSPTYLLALNEFWLSVSNLSLLL
jgi:hypothetical protein